jgi:hypothetical protein
MKKMKNDLINQPFATVKISLRDDSIGQIMKSNLLFSSFFGYQIDQI